MAGQPAVPIRDFYSVLRKLAVLFLTSFGIVSLIGSACIHWIKCQLLIVNNYVQIISPLLHSTTVATALGNYNAAALFPNIDVRRKVSGASPSKAYSLTLIVVEQLQIAVCDTSFWSQSRRICHLIARRQ